MINLLYGLMFLLILCLYGPVFAQTTTQIGASITIADKFIQCVDYVCVDQDGNYVGMLEQVEPGAGEEEQQAPCVSAPGGNACEVM